MDLTLRCYAREAHGIIEFTPEMIAKVKNAAHVWGGVKRPLHKGAGDEPGY